MQRCDKYSADLYGLEISQPRSVPFLCTNGTTSYCSQVWSACANVNITNSIFQPGLQIFPNTSSKAFAPLNTFYSSQASFCGLHLFKFAFQKINGYERLRKSTFKKLIKDKSIWMCIFQAFESIWLFAFLNLMYFLSFTYWLSNICCCGWLGPSNPISLANYTGW